MIGAGPARVVWYRIWLAAQWFWRIFLPATGEFSRTVNKKLALAVVFVLAVVPINYYFFASSHQMEAVAADEVDGAIHRNGDAEHDSGPQENALEHAQKHMDATYVCPMHPQIIRDDPEATCPICGMDLVAMETGGEADVVKLSGTVMNALGVRTEKAKRRTIYRSIDSVGYVTYDEEKLRTVTLRTDGWVERLVVKSEGDRVKRGDLLFEVYSPTLVNAQEEFVQAVELDSGDGTLISASADRLRALGVSDEQVDVLRETKTVQQLVHVYAPQDGIVTKLNIREGMYVPPSKPVVELADLSTVWLVADIFESQVDWVKQRQLAEARLAFMPEKLWTGMVDFIYPTLDPKTRSLKVRLKFDNPDESLKPNMYADVTIYANPRRDALTIPRDAVIQTGMQQRVIMALGEGRFKPVTVTTGTQTNDKVEVLTGLNEGDEVVVSSQFLIDSESSMRAALLRMGGG